MFFVLSKTFWFFAQPSSLITITIIVGLALAGRERFRRLGFRLAWTGIALLLICGLGPIGNVLILPLENRFPARHGKLPETPVAGIIVLGGYEDGRVSLTRGTMTFNEAGERLTEAAWLAHRLPDVPVIITGGAGPIFQDDRPGAVEVREYLAAIGIARDRIIVEDQSKTTLENAILTRAIVKPSPGQKWLLVTSAGHMPRSVGTFRRQGFEVIPWPADFRTKDGTDRWRTFAAIPHGLRRIDDATMEWVGLAAYYAFGRTDALFPAPKP